MNNYSRNSNLSFQASPLYKIKIKKALSGGAFEHVDANFTKLSPDNRADWDLFVKLANKWRNQDYIDAIAEEFRLRCNDVFCVETLEKAPFINRIKSIMTMDNLKEYDEGSDMLVSYLVTDPVTQYGGTQAYKGSGALGVYGAVRRAIDSKLERVLINSTNDKFYKKIGITREVFEEGETFRFLDLKEQETELFLKKIESKYGFDRKA